MELASRTSRPMNYHGNLVLSHRFVANNHKFVDYNVEKIHQITNNNFDSEINNKW